MLPYGLSGKGTKLLASPTTTAPSSPDAFFLPRLFFWATSGGGLFRASVCAGSISIWGVGARISGTGPEKSLPVIRESVVMSGIIPN